MINQLNNSLNVGGIGGSRATPTGGGAGAAGASSFADLLKQSIDEVAKLQQDASQAVQDLATGRTDDFAGVMMAMEKSGLAFKTLLAIRSKLMEAYEEIKQMQI